MGVSKSDYYREEPFGATDLSSRTWKRWLQSLTAIGQRIFRLELFG